MNCKVVVTAARICLLLAVITIPFGMLAAQTIARSQWERDVRQQLRTTAAALSDYDVVPSHEVVVDVLEAGYHQDVEYDLDAGVRYLIVGACDRDCSGLGLKLYDDNWNLIASDRQDQDHPYISIIVRRSTTFHLRVFMLQCEDNPCWWGTGVYMPESDSP